MPASTDGTITLTVRPVDDDPTLDNVTLHAQVDDLANAVTLTSAMIGASDVDSTDNHLSFIVDDSKLTHGYLTLDGYRLQNGGTFTMQDIVDGKVQYVQYASASASGDTDSFNFVVVDNTAALRWNADGTTYSRIGGVYTPGTETLTSFTFTIGLAVVTGGGPGTIPDRVTTITNRDSTGGRGLHLWLRPRRSGRRRHPRTERHQRRLLQRAGPELHRHGRGRLAGGLYLPWFLERRNGRRAAKMSAAAG